MAKRVDYQNPLDNLEEVYEKRNAQIRAWAKADQERADALIGVPIDLTTFDDWDMLESSPPQDPPGGQWQLTDEETASALQASIVEPVEPEPVVEPEPDLDPEEEPEAVPASADAIEVKESAQPKKTPAKKAAAAPKEASSKA